MLAAAKRHSRNQTTRESDVRPAFGIGSDGGTGLAVFGQIQSEQVVCVSVLGTNFWARDEGRCCEETTEHLFGADLAHFLASMSLSDRTLPKISPFFFLSWILVVRRKIAGKSALNKYCTPIVASILCASFRLQGRQLFREG